MIQNFFNYRETLIKRIKWEKLPVGKQPQLIHYEQVAFSDF